MALVQYSLKKKIYLAFNIIAQLNVNNFNLIEVKFRF